jgi:hypothetical protein
VLPPMLPLEVPLLPPGATLLPPTLPVGAVMLPLGAVLLPLEVPMLAPGAVLPPPSVVALPELVAPEFSVLPVVPLAPLVVGGAALATALCFLCFFACRTGFLLVVALEAPVVDAVPLVPDCCCDWISRARCSTAAARAGSVLVVTPVRSCALAHCASDSKPSTNAGYIFFMKTP